MDILVDLNPQQRLAVERDSLPTLIVAGPGTGKTKTLAARIAYLLLSERSEPQNILALTFTAKAAREMSQRVQGLIGDIQLPNISTFHALGYDIICSGREGGLQFITDQSRTELIRSLPKPAGLKDTAVRELSLLVSRVKGAVRQEWPQEVTRFVGGYDQALHKLGLVDFDDLLRQSYQLLKTDQNLCRQLRARYQHVLIDEFQDTSELQWELVQLLRGSDSVFAIGDPKQSIYSFRGAGAAMFDRFAQDLPKYQHVTLDTNYRSAGTIVTLANAIFADQPQLLAHSTLPGQVCATKTLNEYSEADLALQLIEQGIGGSDLQKASVESGGRSFRDFAVLYRTHQAAKALQRRLQDSGIPFQVVGDGSPYDRPQVQAVIGALRWLHQGGDLPGVKGFSAPQVRCLLEGIDTTQPPSQVATAVVDAFKLEGEDGAHRLLLSQLAGTLVRFDDLASCVAHFDQIAQHDFYDPQADAVTLLTIHASKGLEFPHVMLIAAEEGILPHQRKQTLTNYDEERRLFYVAATRAKDRLDIIYAQKRAGKEAVVSRFVQDLPADVLPRLDDPNLAQLQKKLQRRQQKARQSTLF